MSRSLAHAREVTDTVLWKEVENYFHKLLSPGFGKVTRVQDLVASPNGKYLAFTGMI